MSWVKCQLVLVPVADIHTEIPIPTLTWAVAATHEARLSEKGFTYISRDNLLPPLFIVTGVPNKIEYQTKLTDLIDEHNIDEVVRKFIAECEINTPGAIYLPEAGLASVPMKNQIRIQWALQAKINSKVSQELQLLYESGQIDKFDRYLALSDGTLRVPLVDISELQK